jgi:hypothetical protein
LANEDFTTYTEVDDDGDITITASTVDWDTIDRGAISHVSLDKGASFFGDDYTHEWEAEIQTSLDNHERVYGWVVSDTLGTRKTHTDSSVANALFVEWRTDGTPTPGFRLIECVDGNLIETGTVTISSNTSYFLRIVKTSTTVTLSVFTDSARTTHQSGSPVSITLAENNSYNLIYGVMNRGESPGPDANGFTQDLNLDAAAAGVAAGLRTLGLTGAGL